MRVKGAFLPLVGALLCGSCSSGQDIAVGVLNGSLAFDTLDRAFDCTEDFRVTTDESVRPSPSSKDDVQLIQNAGAFWYTDNSTDRCVKFPIVYGAAMGNRPPFVAAKPLVIGIVYNVETIGPAYGEARFRIRPDRTVENLPLLGETAAAATPRLRKIRRMFGSKI